MEEKKKKKPYSKPICIIEEFQLNASFSRTCEVMGNFTLEELCSCDYYRPNLFTYMANCEYFQSNGSPIVDGLCYNTFSDSFNVFNS